MELHGIIAEPEWVKNICPYCQQKLDIRAMWDKKIKKKYRSPKCHEIIDRRFVINELYEYNREKC